MILPSIHVSLSPLKKMIHKMLELFDSKQTTTGEKKVQTKPKKTWKKANKSFLRSIK